ncbi:tetratricopeptide repeat protein [Caulobacter henricii]|uniref:Flagellar protein FlbA n=1 Tax=Caulobacter henricii TaxID=69395 RepID=A0A0P0NZF1_9CAUL|nr:tetratricopeptide repeat protein [Caulobacter henricii]ALL13582.1 flagellar protein FlbA [Caulobacter henricii]
MSRKRALEGSGSSLAQQEVTAAAIVQRGIAGTTMGDSASAEALARLDRAAKELKNRETARLLGEAIAAIHARDFQKADTLALAVLEKDERQGVAWHVLAIAREKNGDFVSSMRAYEAALQLLPDHGPVAGDLGRLAYRMDMPELAAKFFAHYRLARPDCVEATNNLACALRDLNQCAEAIDILRPAIMADQGQPILWNTLGTVMCSLGDGQQALTFFDEALRLAPSFGKGYHNRSYARLDLGDVPGALADCEAAIAHAESVEDLAMMQFARSTILLCLGRVSEGWAAYESRFSHDLSDAPRFLIDAPRWSADQSLTGKRMLICAEQGLGDEVMFANLLPDIIEAIGPEGSLSIAVEHRLIPLFQRSFPDAEVTAHRTVAFEGRVRRTAPKVSDWSKIDLWAPIGSLLPVLRPSIESFPKRPSFLKADPARIAHWQQQLEAAPQGPKVGLLWKSLKLNGERARQFSPFDLWHPVLQTPGVTFVNLQYGDCEEEIAYARDELGVEIWQPEGIDLKKDLDDVAALCCAMDLIIGFSNATINLAGACGAKVWQISGAASWTRLGTDSLPWYPQIRCFSSSDYYDWSPTMNEVAQALADTYSGQAPN